MSRALTTLLLVGAFVLLGLLFLGIGWVLRAWGVPLPLAGLAAFAAMAGVFFGLQKWAGPAE